MGEHVEDNTFRISRITVQENSGTLVSFVRQFSSVAVILRRFFKDTGNNYTRYNYMGEWHSHPSFSLEPSAKDCQTVWEIVDDAEVGANFVVLIIVRQANTNLEAAASLFLPGRQLLKCQIVREQV
jgi:proteasome lid subunit RPN8/RPN11